MRTNNVGLYFILFKIFIVVINLINFNIIFGYILYN